MTRAVARPLWKNGMRDGDYWYDADAGERAVEFYPRYLRHIDGPLRGDRVILAPWHEDEIIRPLFGWKRPHTCARPSLAGGLCLAPNADGLGICEYGLRRYTELGLFVPRKAAKSTICMGISLIMLAADDEGGAQCYVCAWDQDQAGLSWNIAADFVEMSPTLRQKIRVRRSKYRMVYPPLGSFLAAIPAEAVGALGAGAHCVVYDEYETAVNDDLDAAMMTSQAARRQPIMVRTGTAGKTIASPMGRLYLRWKDVLAGVRPARPDELIVLHEAPEDADWRDVRTWQMANPGIGISVQPSFVTKQIRAADEEPTKRPLILQYGLNRWPDFSESWMPLDVWDAAAGDLVDPADLADRECFIGFGMSSARDLAAAVALFPPVADDPVYRLLVRHFIPRNTIDARRNEENAPPYQDWIDRGVLHVFEDTDVLDYDHIEALIGRWSEQFQVIEVVGNPRGGMKVLTDLASQDLTVVEMTPTYKSMSPALTELERLVPQNEFHHGGDLVLRWQMRHLKLRTGPNDEKMPHREASATSLEGVIALLSALNRAIVHGGDQEEERWTAS